jgi:hypothetical protein
VLPSVDRLAVTSLSEALWQARQTGDQRPPFAVIAGCLDELGVALPARRVAGRLSRAPAPSDSIEIAEGRVVRTMTSS